MDPEDSPADVPALPDKPPVVTARSIALSKPAEEAKTLFIKSMGSHADLEQALAASDSPRALKFLELILNPKYKRYGLIKLARMADMTEQDLLGAFRDYYSAKSMMTMMQGLPEVAADMVEDSKSRQVCCPRCDGVGQIVKHPGIDDTVTDCVQCGGTGVTRKPGDSDSRKFIGEAVGMIRRPSAPAAVNINFGAGRIESVIEEAEAIPVRFEET